MVGYAGGVTAKPTYPSIQDHTEALLVEFDTKVLVEFDPKVLTCEDLVLSWTKMHQSVSKGRCQYRSAVWYWNEEQKEVAEEVVKEWRASSRNELYTDVDPVTEVYRAEEYYQHFMGKAARR